MRRIVLKLLSGIYGWIIATFVLASVAYASYSIWDNAQIYQSAENVQDKIREMKPDEEGEDGPTFDELRALNGDVIGWITLDGTNIDYPILKGETNLTYMNKDVYGNFSLAGSIFMDVRNTSDFSDNYTLIYGHNMDEDLMFGDLTLYKDKEFFEENTTATLMTPKETKDYTVAAVLSTSAGTDEIFDPDTWKDNLDGFGEYVKENSTWYHSDLVDMLIKDSETMETVSLATCSDESTNERTVVILLRDKDGAYVKTNKNATSGTSSSNSAGSTTTSSKKTGDTQNPKFWITIIAGVLLFILIFEGIDRLRSRSSDDF